MRAFSICALIVALGTPVPAPVVSGGQTGFTAQCTGESGMYTCTAANGANCVNLTNIWIKGGNLSVVDAKSTTTCKTANNNNPNCSGSAKNYSTTCYTP